MVRFPPPPQNRTIRFAPPLAAFQQPRLSRVKGRSSEANLLRLFLTLRVICVLQGFKVARLQSEFCTKDFLRATHFLTKHAPKFSPIFFCLCFVGQKNPGKFPPNFPLNFPNFPAKNQKKNSPTSFCRSAGRTRLFLETLRKDPLKQA